MRNYKHILFRLKTRKPSKRGFFVRTVINHLDKLQREDRAYTTDNEAREYIAYFIEEAQDCFNSRSTTRLEAEEFLTVFNEARNQKEAFFTASQRLTDFSKTIRTKQIYCIGKIPEEDKVLGVRRLEKLYNIDFNKLEPRTWFFEGETFKSPLWKQRGKPYQINKEIKKRYIDSLPEQPQNPKRKREPLLIRIRKSKMAKLLRTLFALPEPRRELIEDEEAKEDPSAYSEDMSEEEAMEEDLATLEDEDHLW